MFIFVDVNHFIRSNMNIQEKAKKYAEGKIISAMEQAITDAYVEGYNAACEEISHYEKRIINDDGIVYVDMKLPSGTLWATRLLNNGAVKATYFEALKYSIPSFDQWQELIKETAFQVDIDGINIVSVDGTSIHLAATEYDTSGNRAVTIWLKDESDHIVNSKHAYSIHKAINEYSGTYISTVAPGVSFKGQKKPILLVKSKG